MYQPLCDANCASCGAPILVPLKWLADTYDPRVKLVHRYWEDCAYYREQASKPPPTIEELALKAKLQNKIYLRKLVVELEQKLGLSA